LAAIVGRAHQINVQTGFSQLTDRRSRQPGADTSGRFGEVQF
jgi:hypothetical protein